MFGLTKIDVISALPVRCDVKLLDQQFLRNITLKYCVEKGRCEIIANVITRYYDVLNYWVTHLWVHAVIESEVAGAVWFCPLTVAFRP